MVCFSDQNNYQCLHWNEIKSDAIAFTTEREMSSGMSGEDTRQEREENPLEYRCYFFATNTLIK